jgi:hypothetical protein
MYNVQDASSGMACLEIQFEILHDNTDPSSELPDQLFPPSQQFHSTIVPSPIPVALLYVLSVFEGNERNLRLLTS